MTQPNAARLDFPSIYAPRSIQIAKPVKNIIQTCKTHAEKVLCTKKTEGMKGAETPVLLFSDLCGLREFNEFWTLTDTIRTLKCQAIELDYKRESELAIHLQRTNRIVRLTEEMLIEKRGRTLLIGATKAMGIATAILFASSSSLCVLTALLTFYTGLFVAVRHMTHPRSPQELATRITLLSNSLENISFKSYWQNA